MQTRVRSVFGLRGPLACMVASCGLAGPALAVPTVLDFVPADASGVVAINNLGGAKTDVMAFIAASNLMEMMVELPAVLTELDGEAINAGGSAALFMASGVGAEEAIVILPVTNYTQFVTSRGGVGAGIEEVEFGGETVFVRRVSDTFAALCPNEDILEDWQPTAGHRAAHVAALGPRAQRAAEAADVFIIGAISSMAADWRESYEGMKGMAMMFGGPEAAQGFAAIDPLVGAFLTDAQTGVVTLDFAGDGVTARLLSRFNEGSMLAGLFSGQSDTQGLLERLPDMPFGFATAMDTSSPGVRSIMGMITSNLGADAPAQMKAMMEIMNASSGGAMIVGTPTMQEITIGAGAFVRSAAYYRSNDPARLKKALADNVLAANGQKTEQNGMAITTNTVYRPEARKIEGVSVDEWGMTTEIEGDPSDPMAMQAQMAMSTIFGSSGLGGYVAPSDNGVVFTMSRNSQMLTQTLASAKAGTGLGANAAIRQISAKLPDNRAMELYIGVDHLLGIGAAFLGEIPPMPPVGIVAASGDGTAEVALHISPAVISQLSQLGMMFGGMGPGMDFEDFDDFDDEPAF